MSHSLDLHRYGTSWGSTRAFARWFATPGRSNHDPAGQVREILFRPEGVRFLSGRARITSVEKAFVGPEGQETKEFVIDVSKLPGIPWMHDEKPFRMKIYAETDFTLEARKNWEWTPEDEHKPL